MTDGALILLAGSRGLDTARRLRAVLDDAEMAVPGPAVDAADGVRIAAPPAEEMAAAFKAGRPLIWIGATGIAVRLLAPVLGDKKTDPPVVVVAEDGSCVIPLLGGHHGANEMAREMAAALGVSAAVTTGGDLAFGVALDSPPAGWRLANGDDAKPFMAALLRGERLFLDGEAEWLSAARLPLDQDGRLAATVTVEQRQGGPGHLIYHPARLTIGVGCERGCDGDEIHDLIQATLAGLELSPMAVAGLFSLDIKADEIGIHEAATRLGVGARFFDHAALAAQDSRLASPSPVVAEEVGLRGVAEAAALAAAGEDGLLLVSKRKSRRATCAVGLAPSVLAGELPGRARGRLAVVGIGPGRSDWRTGEAARLIRAADLVIGYGLYLELVADLTAGRACRAYPLGAEEDRVRDALAQAAQGRSVALVCSGDAGIYAMASLVFEILDRPDTPAEWRRIATVTAPGISAMQAAAARIGAPLGHDFCAVSLSDLLTPREDILRRVTAAAEGDFVMALYNPVSRRRRELLDRTREILLTKRPPETPVIIARNLGRDGEGVRVVTLAELKTEDVDMLSLVLVGSTRSRVGTSGEGVFVYTPRGYLDDGGERTT